MKESDRRILAAHYISQISGQDPNAIISEYNMPFEHVSERTKILKKNGLIDSDSKITKEGRESLRIVLAGGVFDIIHPGHIHTLSEAKKLGDVLVVVIATDKTALKMKKRRPLHTQEQRKMLVDALRLVDVSVIGNNEDIFITVKLIKPHIIALGYDQIHQEKVILDGCKKIEIEASVARLQSPIPAMSSSQIQEEYGDQIHGT